MDGSGKAEKSPAPLIGDMDPDEDEDDLDKQDEFEAKYNFRFEQPGGDQILSFPRFPEDSARLFARKKKKKKKKKKSKKKCKKKCKKKRAKNTSKARRKQHFRNEAVGTKTLWTNVEKNFPSAQNKIFGKKTAKTVGNKSRENEKKNKKQKIKNHREG